VGGQALLHNVTGEDNIAVGGNALLSNISGNSNTVVGAFALNNSTGSGNIALGFGAGGQLTTGNFNIDIGNPGVVGEAFTIRIGGQGSQTKTFIAGIFPTNVAGGSPVVVDSNGQLGVAASSRRFKKSVQPMDKASEAILALRPVTFQYKTDEANTPQFGLIAEQVAEVDPNLVARNNDGEIYTVRYDAVNAMLLNEFLKEHRTFVDEQRKMKELEATIAQLKKQVETVVAHAKEQDSKIQTVNDEIELNRNNRDVAQIR